MSNQKSPFGEKNSTELKSDKVLSFAEPQIISALSESQADLSDENFRPRSRISSFYSGCDTPMISSPQNHVKTPKHHRGLSPVCHSPELARHKSSELPLNSRCEYPDSKRAVSQSNSLDSNESPTRRISQTDCSEENCLNLFHQHNIKKSPRPQYVDWKSTSSHRTLSRTPTPTKESSDTKTRDIACEEEESRGASPYSDKNITENKRHTLDETKSGDPPLSSRSPSPLKENQHCPPPRSPPPLRENTPLQRAPSPFTENQLIALHRTPSPFTENQRSPLQRTPSPFTENQRSPLQRTPSPFTENQRSPLQRTPSPFTENQRSPLQRTPSPFTENQRSPLQRTPSPSKDSDLERLSYIALRNIDKLYLDGTAVSREGGELEELLVGMGESRNFLALSDKMALFQGEKVYLCNVLVM